MNVLAAVTSAGPVTCSDHCTSISHAASSFPFPVQLSQGRSLKATCQYLGPQSQQIPNLPNAATAASGRVQNTTGKRASGVGLQDLEDTAKDTASLIRCFFSVFLDLAPSQDS